MVGGEGGGKSGKEGREEGFTDCLIIVIRMLHLSITKCLELYH